jgi:hypothetical protein
VLGHPSDLDSQSWGFPGVDADVLMLSKEEGSLGRPRFLWIVSQHRSAIERRTFCLYRLMLRRVRREVLVLWLGLV